MRSAICFEIPAVSCSTASCEKIPSSVGSDIKRPQTLYRVVGHHPTAMQNHNMRTDALHRFKLMRAEQNYLSPACEFLNQAPQDKGRTDIEPRKRFVQKNKVGIV